MNFKRGIFLLCLFLLVGFFCDAQANLSSENLSTLNVDDLSDKQIRSYMQRAKDNNVKEELVYTILAEKGLPQEEIDKLKDRIANLPPVDKKEKVDENEDVSSDKEDD